MKLIESIPLTLGVTPTLTVVERKVVADVKIIAHPDGIPVRPSVDENWFNPNLGLTFYRSSGGTGRRGGFVRPILTGTSFSTMIIRMLF